MNLGGRDFATTGFSATEAHLLRCYRAARRHRRLALSATGRADAAVTRPAAPDWRPASPHCAAGTAASPNLRAEEPHVSISISTREACSGPSIRRAMLHASLASEPHQVAALIRIMFRHPSQQVCNPVCVCVSKPFQRSEVAGRRPSRLGVGAQVPRRVCSAAPCPNSPHIPAHLLGRRCSGCHGAPTRSWRQETDAQRQSSFKGAAALLLSPETECRVPLNLVPPLYPRKPPCLCNNVCGRGTFLL